MQFPQFIALCNDDVWGVRKSCVESMMSVACRVPFRLRLSMSQTLIKLCDDDSRWVRISACQILGPYISTFAARFNEMAHNQYGELVYSSQQGNELR